MEVDGVLLYRDIVSLRIRLHRSLRKLKQSTLAKKARVSQSTIAHIELGLKFPSIGTLIKIAHALEVKPHLLFTPLPPSMTDSDLY